MKINNSICIGIALLLLSVTQAVNAERFGVPEIASENSFPVVLLETSLGDIKIELNRKRAPITVNNFLRYLTEGYYNGTVFHRVLSGFVVQGGSFHENLKERDVHAGIINESGNGLANNSYTIAMARYDEPHSATASFYFNVNENDALNPSSKRWGYTVFGMVVEGEDVIDKIAALPVHTDPVSGFENIPIKPVFLYKAVLLPAEF